MILRLLSILAGAILLTGSTHAENLSASFRFISFDPRDSAPLYAKSKGGKWNSVEHPSAFIGRPVRLAHNGTLQLFDTDPSTLKTDAPAPPPVAEAKNLPAVPRQLVFLFRSGDKRIAKAIPDTAESLPTGACLFVNMTKSALRFTHGGTVTEIPAESMRKTQPPARRTASGDVNTKVETAPDNRLVYSTVWVYHEKMRSIVFAYEPTPGTPQLRVVNTVDSPELNEAADSESTGGKPAKKH